MMKVKITNRKLWGLFSGIISFLCAIESFVLMFYDLSEKTKFPALIVNVVVIVIIFFGCWFCSNHKQEKNIRYGNIHIKIKFGDLFEQDGLRVINFNEYFDTKVDDVIISTNSLNGRVIKTFVSDIPKLDSEIESNIGCQNRIAGHNPHRPDGKKTKYSLGTCFRYDKYIFVAFSKFDKNNQAYLGLSDYLQCMSDFWREMNRVYNGEDVVVPLMGSGITRRINMEKMTYQEQLEIMLDTLRFNNLSFAHNCTITIVLPENLQDEISLFDI